MRTEKIDSGIREGQLYVFEGPDGVGKSTISEKVADRLRGSGVDILHLSFPGRESKTIGKLVYTIHHDPNSVGVKRLSPISLQVLHIAAHIDCIENRIAPALASGKTVILDRFWWSTIVYGLTAGIKKHILNAMINLERTAWGSIKPDKVFLIKRDEPFRAELSDDQWIKVCNEYKNISENESKKYPIKIIENSKSFSAVVDKVVKLIHNENPAKSRSREHIQKVFNLTTSRKIKKKTRRVDHWAPTKTTEVFDTYWRFAVERQEIFFRRLRGEKQPWSEDHIFQKYKFTNAYRASDRVSQFLIKQVIYEGESNPEEIFFRTILFKIFNRIDTWKLLVEKLGQVTWKDYNYHAYDQILTKTKENKISIYSGAYIMPSGGRSFGYKFKHRNHLKLIEKMMMDDLPDKITDAKSMHHVFEMFRSYPMIGDFLAYQYATDINYSELTNFNEMSFVIPGPGARDGIKKCFSDFGGLSEVDLIRLMVDRQEQEFERLGIKFRNLWGRQLQLIDCQNLFCEVDKYSRIAHPDIQGITGRTRIKQKFYSSSEPIQYFYPPEWKINKDVKKTMNEK